MAATASRVPCVALFDLDGTLTWRDTLFPYLMGYAAHHPARLRGLWRLAPAVMKYGLRTRDRGALKSDLIRSIMGDDTRTQVDAWSDSFVSALPARGAFRPAALAILEAHRAAGDHLVLLSASPDLYVPRIGRMLGFERTVCTEIRWTAAGPDARLDGSLATPNRRGEEKTRCLEWLRSQYRDVTVVAYGNSDSDLPHLVRADRALLVNGGAKARRLARAAGIPVGAWN